MEPLPIYVPADARFTCHRCGACCRRLTGVDLLDGDLARLQERDWASEGPRFARGFLEPRLDADAPHRLKVVGGQCIFLDDDGLCLVHLRLGEASKPTRCRAFPLRFASAPDGIHVAVSPECQSLHRSYREGDLVEATPTLSEIADRMPRLFVFGRRFVLFGGEPPSLTWEDVRALLDDAVDQTRPDAPEPLCDLPRALLRPVRRALGGPVPRTPWPFEGPPDVPFYQALDYLGGELAPIAHSQGLAMLASAFAELRRYQVWRRAAERLDAPGQAFARQVLTALIQELRPLQLGEVVAGLGSALYLTMAAVVGAGRLAEVQRGADARPGAAEVNRLADEACQFYRVRVAVDVMTERALALERLIFDAPAPVPVPAPRSS